MHWASVLGLFALLGIAWAISVHRTKVNLRTVVWGIGLQFLLGVIILRDNYLSFVGMGIFAGLIGLYILLRPGGLFAGRLPMAIATLAGIGICTATLGWRVPSVLPWIVLISLVAAIGGGWLKLPDVVRQSSTLVMLAGTVAWLVDTERTGSVVFKAFSEKVAAFLSLSDYGSRFLFGNLADGQYFFPGPEAGWPGFGFQFAFKALPTIIFFGGLMGVLYHWGVMQKVIEAMARFMRWTIGTSGAETLSCSANIFVGQTEAPLLIKPFLDEMTDSELLTIMVGGFATIAGGVLAAYVALGVDAGHLIAASVMSAPAALVFGKIIFPETEHSVTAGDVSMPKIDTGANTVEAATGGITDGFKLALNVGAMLIGFIALIAVVDVLFNWVDSLIDGRLLHGAWVSYGSGGMSPVVGEFAGIFPGSLQTLFGTILRPLAWLMGVPWAEAGLVGNLLGIKLSLNEFVAFGQLGQYIQAAEGLSPRAIAISTYALCGFANFSSIGIQIGGIAAVAPGRRSDLARLGVRAMLGGALASWMTATIAGILL
ncbi:MAG: nucleoside transporter C-terminal domain-containing protein [Acidobacteriota bacterium]